MAKSSFRAKGTRTLRHDLQLGAQAILLPLLYRSEKRPQVIPRW